MGGQYLLIILFILINDAVYSKLERIIQIPKVSTSMFTFDYNNDE